MNADERGLKRKQSRSWNPCLSVFIRGQEVFSATCSGASRVQARSFSRAAKFEPVSALQPVRNRGAHVVRTQRAVLPELRDAAVERRARRRHGSGWEQVRGVL